MNLGRYNSPTNLTKRMRKSSGKLALARSMDTQRQREGRSVLPYMTLRVATRDLQLEFGELHAALDEFLEILDREDEKSMSKNKAR